MNNGFGLLEIMAALLLLSFITFALLNGLLSAHQHALASTKLTREQLTLENNYESNEGLHVIRATH